MYSLWLFWLLYFQNDHEMVYSPSICTANYKDHWALFWLSYLICSSFWSQSPFYDFSFHTEKNPRIIYHDPQDAFWSNAHHDVKSSQSVFQQSCPSSSFYPLRSSHIWGLLILPNIPTYILLVYSVWFLFTPFFAQQISSLSWVLLLPELFL
jgi:hypothetical protein